MKSNLEAIAKPTGEMLFQNYESSLKAARLQILEKALQPLHSDNNPQTVMLFWIYFSTQGVGMTEPVEDWINRAGNRCKALGYTVLGEKLCKHAIHEAGHEQMMIKDAKKLVSLWNKTYTPKLDVTTLLNSKAMEAVEAYKDLHEFYINSTVPYGQIAIEYELENLAASDGTQTLKHSADLLGKDFLNCLSFVKEHVRIDVAHTKYNRESLTDFLKVTPDALPTLIEAGKKALHIYGEFWHTCHAQAQVFLNKQST